MNTKQWLVALSSILLCVALCATCMTVSAANAVTFSLMTDKTTANVGDTVTVSVNISEKSYLANGTFYLHFDNTAVSYVQDSENAGSAAGNGTMFAANGFHDEGYVKIALVTGSSIKKSGALMTFDFRVLKKAPAAFSFTSDECVGCGEDEVDFDIAYTSKGCVLNDDGSVTAPVITPDVPVVVTTTTKKPATTASKGSVASTTAATVATTAATQSAQTDTAATTASVADGTTEASADGTVTTSSVKEGTEATTSTPRFLNEIDDTDEIEPNGLTVAIVIIVIAVVVAVALTAAALIARKKRADSGDTLSPAERVVDNTDDPTE